MMLLISSFMILCLQIYMLILMIYDCNSCYVVLWWLLEYKQKMCSGHYYSGLTITSKLIMISITHFNVILSMNLLAKYFSIINTERWGWNLMSGEKAFYFSCKKNILFSLISAVKLSKYLMSEESIFFCQIWSVE